MTEITLNHTIVPCHNRVDSAKFYARIFGFAFERVWGPFAVVRVNPSLMLDFMEKEQFYSLHYAFKVDDVQFDAILNRIISEQIVYGSGPDELDDGQINHLCNGRGAYFKDPNGHILEFITADYILD